MNFDGRAALFDLAYPVSSLPAVPIVLLDCLLSPEPTELPHGDIRTLPQRTVERCELSS
jgi:hypothetical protein